MSKSWREQAATDAAASLLKDTDVGEGTFEVTNEPFVYLENAELSGVSCEGCYTKEDIKQVGVGNRMHGEKPHMMIHLCPSCRTMLGLELLDGGKKEFVVTRKEERLGEYTFKVLVPKTVSDDVVMANFTMASKYAQTELMYWKEFNEAERADYDEHFEEIGKLRDEGNGDDVFAHYLVEFCDYEIVDYEKPKPNFVYEW